MGKDLVAKVSLQHKLPGRQIRHLDIRFYESFLVDRWFPLHALLSVFVGTGHILPVDTLPQKCHLQTNVPWVSSLLVVFTFCKRTNKKPPWLGGLSFELFAIDYTIA